jgi:hypothetical protein
VDVGALLMNAAHSRVYEWENADPSFEVPIAREGAGRVDAVAAVRGDTLVRVDGGVAELGFGIVHAEAEAMVLTRTLRVRNLGTTPSVYSLAPRFLHPDEDADAGVTISVTPDRVSVAPGETATSTVRLDLAPGELKALPLDSTQGLSDEPAFRRQEVDGSIEIVSEPPVEGAEPVGIPFYVLPLPASCADGGVDADRLHLDNPCPQGARLLAYPEIGRDPAEASVPDPVDIVSVGARRGTLPEPEAGGCASVLEFDIATAGPRRLPADTEFRVFMDFDRDGVFDRVGVSFYGADYFGLPAGRWSVQRAPEYRQDHVGTAP